MTATIEQFANSMRNAGLDPDEQIIAEENQDNKWSARYLPEALDAELDRLMTLGFGIGRKWRNIVLDEGRETALMELRWEIARLECDEQRRQEQEARKVRKQNMSLELIRYQGERKDFCQGRVTYTQVWAMDADFLERMTLKGYDVDTWLDQWGATLSSSIDKIQWNEKFGLEHHRIKRENARKWELEKAEKLRLKDEADQRQDDKLEQIIFTAVGKVAIEFIASGVRLG